MTSFLSIDILPAMLRKITQKTSPTFEQLHQITETLQKNPKIDAEGNLTITLSPQSVIIWTELLHQFISKQRKTPPLKATPTSNPIFFPSEPWRVKFQADHKISPAVYLKSCAQITISVGCSEEHYGQYFERTLHEALKTFGRIVIMVDDSIQWRTLKIKHPEYAELSNEALKIKALEHGEQWLTEHHAYIELMKAQYPDKISIVRWYDFTTDQRYQPVIDEIHAIYDTTDYNGTGNAHPIKKAIDKTAEAFRQRIKKQVPNILLSDAEISALSREYLIEECAIMKEFWPRNGVQFELYPGTRTPAMTAVHEHFIKPTLSREHPYSLEAVKICFNKKYIAPIQTEDHAPQATSK